MIDFETATMVYKSLHGLAPPYMQDMFHKLSHSRKRVLRSTETDLQGRTFKFCLGECQHVMVRLNFFGPTGCIQAVRTLEEL